MGISLPSRVQREPGSWTTPASGADSQRRPFPKKGFSPQRGASFGIVTVNKPKRSERSPFRRIPGGGVIRHVSPLPYRRAPRLSMERQGIDCGGREEREVLWTLPPLVLLPFFPFWVGVDPSSRGGFLLSLRGEKRGGGPHKEDRGTASLSSPSALPLVITRILQGFLRTTTTRPSSIRAKEENNLPLAKRVEDRVARKQRDHSGSCVLGRQR